MPSSLVRPVVSRALVAGTALTAVTLLAGCSAVQSLVGGVEPERDEETGEVMAAVEANAFALRVGDCIDADEEFTEEVQDVASVPTVPCDQAHDSEIYAATEMTDETYPGDETVASAADEFCYGEFESFVGLPYEDSVLYFSAMYPSPESWELGDDREILCVVVDEAGGRTATMADAGV
ncbi:septum formation family protein [Cellulomonas marina]|uniref:Septum formation n=1 Tax=Cellulomonas marina TaxID=988821 RepID=A0A1I0WBF4_9CELL|nr:septum formation family protein [Cellulomonas marina]GIG29069.1 hypothetical protein Cma02nite_16690 [Cellulomonas marina]SFA85598.1 Septum formation [Cellulomonas marina]